MYLHASRPLAGLSRGPPHMRHVGLRRGLASVSSASSKARLSRFETDHTIDYAELTRRIESSRKILGRPLTPMPIISVMSPYTAERFSSNWLAGILTVKGGTGAIIEFFGPGTESLSATGMATICNMGAETGATTSIFPYSEAMRSIIDINLSELEPIINGPFTLDLSTPISKLSDAVDKEGWPKDLTAGLIGSCTNSSFQDMSRAAELAKQAVDAGLQPKMPLFVSPGSEQTRKTWQENGVLQVFEELGSKLLTNSCGPCCGSWDRQDMEKGVKNSFLTSYNRNFTGRLDGNPATHIFLASSKMPPAGETLPSHGYANTDYVYSPPPSTGRNEVEVQIAETSKRLQRLAPASAQQITSRPPAGPWFAYRGHLRNISNNTLIGAVNAETGKVNQVKNWLTGQDGDVPGTAQAYKEASQPWVVIGDHNYGEGSSREHAVLQPRYLGCVAIMAKSFARIHETNLKKQGLLALKFVKESDYERISSSDRISIVGIKDLKPGKKVEVRITPTTAGRESFNIEPSHTLTGEQIEYFREGSALNLMAKRKQQKN
ncbi:putative aconitate hydratase [Colletotrichum viniferum]|nr:putative aconitate hydratase [Colletotrichum viniferum]